MGLQGVALRGFLSAPAAAFGSLLTAVTAPLAALLLITIGCAFLTTLGYDADKRKLGLFAGVVGAAAALVLFHFTLLSLMIALALLLLSMYVVVISNVYAKELKKWVFFRTGTHAISKALLIFNILVALGVVFTVAAALPAYQQGARSAFVDALVESIPGVDPAPGLERETAQVRNYIASTVDNIPLFSAYLRWLPLLAGLSIFVVLEFLRALVFANVGGVCTTLFLRLRHRSAHRKRS